MRSPNLQVKRGKQVVYTGKVASLRRIKDNVDEVRLAGVFYWGSVLLPGWVLY